VRIGLIIGSYTAMFPGGLMLKDKHWDCLLVSECYVAPLTLIDRIFFPKFTAFTNPHKMQLAGGLRKTTLCG
jgi:hypothetical protein